MPRSPLAPPASLAGSAHFVNEYAILKTWPGRPVDWTAMSEALHLITVEEARSDHHERSLRHASNCVCLAVVTPEALAAELIDTAIEIRQKTRNMERPA